MAPIRYSLHYEDYSEHLMSRFGKLLQTQSLVDMTLMCSSHTLRVHKAVLSASSAYFQEVLQKQTGEPLIILKMGFGVLKCLVEFMYCGKTQCLEENMDELVSAAQFLKIKGLSKVTKEGLGISSTSELPVFTPPVVINRPPQSLIDLHTQDVGESTLKTQSATSSNQLIDNQNKDMVVRIPFDIEAGNNAVDYADPTRLNKPRRGRPSFRRAGWESGTQFGRATERALLRREQDSRKAILQLKNLQSGHIQDSLYMDRTLTQAVNSISDTDTSKKNYMNIDNDLIYMDQTIPTNVLNPNNSYIKDQTLSNETMSSYPATSTKDDTDGISNAMSQYVNALKNAGLPTDLPILFESGDGSYINVNEQVLLDMVQSSEIQYEVIEQPNIMEKVSDPSEIKSIDELSKSIERGEMLMNPKHYSNSDNFDKDTMNSLNEILPDNLDSFSEQQNYTELDRNLTNNNSVDQDNTDFSCIDSDMQFFTKSMSDDVKKYYEEDQLGDSREIDQFCPASTTLDTNFNMSLLDTKITHLTDPINDPYNTTDLSRNDDFDFEAQLQSTNFKDDTLDYLIHKRSFDEDKQVQERDEIIKDLMNIEINMTDNIDVIEQNTHSNHNNKESNLEASLEHKTPEIDVVSDKENVEPTTTETWDVKDSLSDEKIDLKLKSNTDLEPINMEDEISLKDSLINKDFMEIITEETDKSKINDSSTNEDIPFAVGLLPLKEIQAEVDSQLKRKNDDYDYGDNVDAKCLKRKKKYKKI